MYVQCYKGCCLIQQDSIFDRVLRSCSSEIPLLFFDVVSFHFPIQNDWYPLYHTTYETFKDVKLFIDPDFTYHQTMSRFVSEIVRSLADSVIIPFTAKPYGIRMKQIYVTLKTNVLDDLRKQGLESSLGKMANQTWLLAF